MSLHVWEPGYAKGYPATQLLKDTFDLRSAQSKHFPINVGHIMHFFLLKTTLCHCLWLLAFSTYCGQWVAEYVCGLEDRERVGIRRCSQLISLGGKMLTEFHKENERQRIPYGPSRMSVVEAVGPLKRQLNSHSKVMPQVRVFERMCLPFLWTLRLPFYLVFSCISYPLGSQLSSITISLV